MVLNLIRSLILTILLTIQPLQLNWDCVWRESCNNDLWFSLKKEEILKQYLHRKKNSGIKSSTEYQKESLATKTEKLQKNTKRTKGEL